MAKKKKKTKARLEKKEEAPKRDVMLTTDDLQKLVRLKESRLVEFIVRSRVTGKPVQVALGKYQNKEKGYDHLYVLTVFPNGEHDTRLQTEFEFLSS